MPDVNGPTEMLSARLSRGTRPARLTAIRSPAISLLPHSRGDLRCHVGGQCAGFRGARCTTSAFEREMRGL